MIDLKRILFLIITIAVVLISILTMVNKVYLCPIVYKNPSGNKLYTLGKTTVMYEKGDLFSLSVIKPNKKLTRKPKRIAPNKN